MFLALQQLTGTISILTRWSVMELSPWEFNKFIPEATQAAPGVPSLGGSFPRSFLIPGTDTSHARDAGRGAAARDAARRR
jgi:hypothetical protein